MFSLQYRAEDFAEFDSLVHMNASDSALPFGEIHFPQLLPSSSMNSVLPQCIILCAEAFKTFPVLEQLELCTCSISDISVDHTDFSKLQASSHFK